MIDFVQPSPPGTILVLSDERRYQKQPSVDYQVLFGRGGDDVHLAVGVDDPYVSRRQGALAWDGQDWQLRNLGRLPIRLIDDSMILQGQQLRLRTGCTPLLVGAPAHRVHLVEVHVAGFPRHGTQIGPDTPTKSPDVYELTEMERLAVVALAQRYLRQDAGPTPMTWAEAAAELNRVPRERRWSSRSVEHVIGALRQRLATTGRNPIPGILRGEMPEPVGNTLNHNLITALVRTATLTPDDLRLLGEEDEL
jgi:hypothetical protein